MDDIKLKIKEVKGKIQKILDDANKYGLEEKFTGVAFITMNYEK